MFDLEIFEEISQQDIDIGTFSPIAADACINSKYQSIRWLWFVGSMMIWDDVKSDPWLDIKIFRDRVPHV